MSFLRHWVLLLILLPALAGAQQNLTLEYCIQTALQNNLQVKQQVNTLETSRINVDQSKYNWTPTLNGSVSMYNGFGTNFDQFTFQRVNTTTTTSSMNLNSSVVLFEGFNKFFQLHQSEYQFKAAEYAVQKTRNNIQMTVALNFFQVVYDQQNLKIAQDRLTLLESQLDLGRKKLSAGTSTQGEVLNLEAQVANEKLNVINSETQLKKDLLTLIQSVDLDATIPYTISAPDIKGFTTTYLLPSLDAVYSHALENMPEMQEQRMNILASTYGLKSAKSDILPTLSLNASMGGNYSSNGILNPRTFKYEDMDYFGQIQENFSKSLSFSLQIPIFNRHSTTFNIRRQELALQNAELSYQNQKNALIKSIQQAYLDVQSARIQYDAAAEQVTALNLSFQNIKARYDLGLIDFYTYLETLNNKTKAELQMNQSLFNYILKTKILDLYQGKNITL